MIFIFESPNIVFPVFHHHDYNQSHSPNSLEVDAGLLFAADTSPFITGAILGTAVVSISVPFTVKHGHDVSYLSVSANSLPVLVAARTSLPGAGPWSSVLSGIIARALVTSVVKGLCDLRSKGFSFWSSVETAHLFSVAFHGP